MNRSAVVQLRATTLLLLCGIGVTLAGCGSFRSLPGFPDQQAYYQTAFPVHDTSGTLERTFASVLRIWSDAAYVSYFFAEESAPVEGTPTTAELLALAADVQPMSQDRAATAVAISRRGANVALLTANHALELPDTIVVYFEPGSGPTATPAGGRRVQSISVKTQQSSWVVGATRMLPFEILARDGARDLALIGIHDPEPELPEYPMPVEPFDRPPQATPVLSLAAGDSDRLSWGSFVYVLGFPQGYPMVTRGLVSAPGDPVAGAFIVDGLWNRGMSGGLILAVRADGLGLEWVGVARGAAATAEVRLVPEEGTQPEQGVRRPYDGGLYLEETQRIDYGITLSIPMTEIRRFLIERRPAVEARGYSLPRL